MILFRALALALEAVDSSISVNPENADKLVWVSAGLTVVTLVLLMSFGSLTHRIYDSKYTFILFGYALAVGILSISWVQTIEEMSRDALWFGFGLFVTLIALAIIPILSRVLTETSRPLIWYIGIISILIFLVWYLPSLLQPPWGVIDFAHSSLVVNEILAQGAGVFPLGNFTAQYTSLLGWFIAPIIFFVDPVLSYLVASIWLSLLSVLTISGVIFLGWKVLPERIRPLSVILTVPLILVKGTSPESPFGSITALFSAIPIRTFPLVATGILLLLASRNSKFTFMATLGLASGLSAINNFEFGVPILISVVIVLLVSTTPERLKFSLLGFSLGVLGSALLVVSLLQVAGQKFEIARWVAFVLGFQSGFGSIQMPVTGTYVIILMILGSGSITGLYWLIRNRRTADRFNPEVARKFQAAILASFAGLTGLATFGYYVGRSVTSGQLQIFLLNAALVIVAILGLIEIPDLLNQKNVKGVLSSILILLPPALAVAAIVQAPDPQQQWERVSPYGKENPLFTPDTNLDLIRQKIDVSQIELGYELSGAAVRMGNYAQIRLGIENLSVIDNPSDVRISTIINNQFCDRLGQTSGVILAQDFIGYSGNLICVDFMEIADLGDGFILIEKNN